MDYESGTKIIQRREAGKRSYHQLNEMNTPQARGQLEQGLGHCLVKMCARDNTELCLSPWLYYRQC